MSTTEQTVEIPASIVRDLRRAGLRVIARVGDDLERTIEACVNLSQEGVAAEAYEEWRQNRDALTAGLAFLGVVGDRVDAPIAALTFDGDVDMLERVARDALDWRRQDLRDGACNLTVDEIREITDIIDELESLAGQIQEA